MDAERSQSFNDRLSHWVASQGFWFQLRHSLSGGGWSGAFFHLLRLGLRLLIVALIVGAGFAVYLMKRVETDEFRVGLENRFAEAMAAEAAKISDFRRSGGKALIRRIGARGGPESFYQSFEATNLSFSMGLMDGLSGSWDAEVVDIGILDIELKGGASSPEAAKQAAALVLGRHPGFSIRGFEVSRARISWGSKDTWKRTGVPASYGEINNSKLSASRLGDDWRMIFEGGTFSQNWIRGYEIQRLSMVLSSEGLRVESGELRNGESRIEFRDVQVSGGEYPEFSGRIALKKVPLGEVLPDRYIELVDGTFSSELTLSGSSNSSSGVQMKGKVVLGDDDSIILRNRIPLLDALNQVDVFHAYKKVELTEGSFTMETGGGKLAISDIELEARGLLRMKGGFEARYPSHEEIVADLGAAPGTNMQSILVQEAAIDDAPGITLKQAGKAVASEDEDDEDEANRFFAEMAEDRQQRRETEVDQQLRHQRSEALYRARRMLRFSGEVQLQIPGDAFENSAALHQRYPVEPESGRIPLVVPIRGIMSELTLQQAEDLLRLDRGSD